LPPRAGDRNVDVENAKYAAAQIAGARYVDLPGDDHLPWIGDAEAIVGEIERFLTEIWNSGWEAPTPDRLLATVLFTDIVGSTVTAVELGDSRWRELIGAHHDRVRSQIAQFRGIEMDTAGDGFFARFDGPARAIECARAIRNSVKELGIDIRAGLHTGECEQMDSKVGGVALITGARIAAQAEPNEILVSATVRDLVAGSGIEFEDGGAN
jgi:class 3 adenylate cyclase